MSEKLVSDLGFYELRGGIVYSIGKLMEINDLLFKAQQSLPSKSGVTCDYRPIFSELAQLIEKHRVVMDNQNK